MNIQTIREQKSAAVAEARAIVAGAEKENRSLTADEAKSFDTAKSRITELEAAESRASFLSEQERAMTGEPVHGDNRGTLESRVSLLDVIRAKLEGRALTGAAAEYHQEAERRTGRRAEGVFVPMSLLEKRVNTTTSAPDLIANTVRADQYIGPLRESLLVRQMGVRVLSGLTGDVTIPKAGDGLTASWVAENEAIPESNMTFNSITLSPKHVGALTEMSRQLIQQASPSIEQLVRDDLAYAVAKEVDRAIIAGDGVKEPLGIINRTGIQTVPALPASWQDILAMVQMLNAINVDPTAWYTTPGVMSGLRGTLKEAGLAGYIAEGGKIADLPAYVSNAAPAATAIVADWSQILLGVWGELDLLVNPYAETAYRRGGVLVRAMATMDVGVRHEEAFVVAPDPTP